MTTAELDIARNAITELGGVDPGDPGELIVHTTLVQKALLESIEDLAEITNKLSKRLDVMHERLMAYDIV
ncbi:MAG: hypothetical protein DLM63_00230 [Solirubrobacterales bacterium]|nr:MAG: hypothetical protein DLM63_00230 [Solirubrobacterales bacterium]